MRAILFTTSLIFTMLLISATAASQGRETMISGKIISTENEIIDFATVYLKGTSHGGTTNAEGIYHIKAPAGKYTLVVSAIGYATVEQEVTLTNGERTRLNIKIKPETTNLDEVVIVSNGISRLKRSAFNAVAIDTKALQNTTQNLSDALMQLPGMKLRESGGVGSDMKVMLDGFSGNHVKVFIDGVPQEGVGSSFGLNNIPVNFADRIEVYKGVVPVEFGTDALGGVINIVTNKNRRKWFADASYSYGSFNTHRSYINFGQTFKNGLMYEVNAFQNYSDNDYHIDTYVTQFNDDGTTTTDRNAIERVKRFNDTYHNEAIVGKIGLVDKKFADRLILSFTYSQMYKEIQTGVRQNIVYGQKHRKGQSYMPSLEYLKRNFLVKGLDLSLNANYNHNLTQNIDTASYIYNWYGQRKYTGTPGEQSYLDNEAKNTNWNATARATYRIGSKHTFTLNHVFTSFKRTSRSYVNSSSVISDFTIPKETRKNITGLSYRLILSEKLNFSAFAKYYDQYNAGPVSQNDDGIGNYISMTKNVSTTGFGAAGTYYILKDMQAKLSYERAYRLPSTDELFGDDDIEAGRMDLKPEKSDNFNLNLSHTQRFGVHQIYMEGSLIYRDTKDYIRRAIETQGNSYFGSHENHGHVVTKGFNLSLRYSYSHWLSLGGTYNNMNSRNEERYISGSSQQESNYYKSRMPNQPYRFANFDVSFFWRNLLAKGNTLSVTYDSFYLHEFPLHWENLGSADTKQIVPEQFSHNIRLTYSMNKGKYNLSFECKNITDEALYDNFALQKAGRAFYGKFRVYFGQ